MVLESLCRCAHSVQPLHNPATHRPVPHCIFIEKCLELFTSATCPQLDHLLDNFVPYDNLLTLQFTFTFSSLAFTFTFDFCFFIASITRLTRFKMFSNLNTSLIVSIVSLIALVSHTTFTSFKQVRVHSCH